MRQPPCPVIASESKDGGGERRETTLLPLLHWLSWVRVLPKGRRVSKDCIRRLTKGETPDLSISRAQLHYLMGESVVVSGTLFHSQIKAFGVSTYYCRMCITRYFLVKHLSWNSIHYWKLLTGGWYNVISIKCRQHVMNNLTLRTSRIRQEKCLLKGCSLKSLTGKFSIEKGECV